MRWPMTGRTRQGLGLLPPPIRLVLVIAASSSLVLVTSLQLALVAFFSAAAVLIVGGRIRWGLVVVGPILVFISVFVGNAFWGPFSESFGDAFRLHLSAAGISRGIVMALRYSALVTIGLAWLFNTTVPEMYRSFVPLYRWKTPQTTSLVFFRALQTMLKEYACIGNSLRVRGLQTEGLPHILLHGRWTQLRRNAMIFLGTLRAIIPRLFERIGLATLARESHQRTEGLGRGQLVVDGLSVEYDPLKGSVLKDVTFSVAEGDFVWVGGLSGAGKTTLLMALGGVVPWIRGGVKGRITIGGRALTTAGFTERCATIRYVSPDPGASILGMTVGQEIRTVTTSDQQGRDALTLLGLERFWSRETTKLSGGEQARLIAATALASENPVLLFDSPLDELDPSGRLDLLGALGTLTNQGNRTIFVADCDPRPYATMVSRFVFLNDGELVATGSGGAEAIEVAAGYSGKLLPCGGVPNARELGDLVAVLDDVYVSIDGEQILRGVSLSVRRGECVVIRGPNGSGKTTAMNVLAGLLQPTQGTRWVGTQRIAYVFQDVALQMVAPTSGEEIAVAPILRGWSSAKIAAWRSSGLDWVGVTDESRPSALHPSKQRFLGLKSMDVDSDVLILDEPTIGLDPRQMEKFCAYVRQSLIQGTAVLIVSHDSRVSDLAKRALEFTAGTCHELQLKTGGSIPKERL